MLPTQCVLSQTDTEMAALTKNLNPHFSHVHPNHHLIHNTTDQANYICHACKTTGFGDRFRCHVCIADIHVYCANCPHQLSSSFHSHPLSLILSKPQTHHRTTTICDICRESIDGVSYRCSHCDFDVHPLCTQLPEKVRHVIDDYHSLRLQKSSFGNCGVCGIDCCSLWVYGCDGCRVNIHIKCLRKSYGSKKSSGTRGIQNAPPPSTAEKPHFNGGFPPGYGGNYYYGYGFPWGVPNSYYGYPGYPFPYNNNIPNYPPYHGGGHGHGHGHGHESSSSSSNWGSLFGNTMFSLIGNIASGAINGFLFGSIGF